MSESKCWLALLCIREFRQLCYYIDQFLSYQLQRFGHDNDICIISYIAGSRAEMNDSFSLRTLYAICIDMGHNIMTDDFLPLLCHVIVDIIRVTFQLFDLLVCDIEAQLFLCLSQSDPESSPCTELLVR